MSRNAFCLFLLLITAVIALHAPRAPAAEPSNQDYLDYQLGRADTNPAAEATGLLLPGDTGYDDVLRLLRSDSGAADGGEDDVTAAGIVPLEVSNPDLWLAWKQIPGGEDSSWTISLTLAEGRGDPPSSLRVYKNAAGRLPLQENEEIWSVDPLPYDLGALGKAYGVRTIIHGCGAGGNLCYSTYLHLFLPQKNGMREIFSDAVAYYGYISGDWQEDGSREHTDEQQTAALHVVFPDENHQGPPSLVLTSKDPDDKSVRTYKPVTDEAGHIRYTTFDAPFIEDVTHE